MSGRYSQLSRFYYVLRLLEKSPHGLTAQEILSKISEQFQVTKRSIYRDLEALSAAGFQVERESKKKDAKWFIAKESLKSKKIALNSREILALVFAEKHLDWFKGSPYFSDINNAFKKIKLLLPNQTHEYFSSLLETTAVKNGVLSLANFSNELFDTIQACMDECQLLQITYDSQSSKKRTRILAPEFIYAGKGAVYLVATDIKDKELKTFSLARMSSPKMLDRIYTPQNISPDKFFSGSFGIFKDSKAVKVRLKFNKKLEKYLKERQWHESQRLIQCGDDSIEMRLLVGINQELLSWILGFGANVEVLEPKSLRDLVLGSVERVLKAYG